MQHLLLQCTNDVDPIYLAGRCQTLCVQLLVALVDVEGNLGEQFGQIEFILGKKYLLFYRSLLLHYHLFLVINFKVEALFPLRPR